MNLQIFSDLHAGVRPVKPITVGKNVDVVAVAGDICEGARNAFIVIRRIVPETIPVVFTMGNHEYYRRFLRDELEAAKTIGPDYNITVIEDNVVVIGGVRFVGASLWTDYQLFGANNAPAAMNAARTGMNDHRLIGWRKEPWERFRPQEALMLHAASRAFFADTLSSPFNGATVALSHHAPHARSVPDRFASDILSAAFASSVLDELIAAPDLDRDAGARDVVKARPRVDLWIHGHIHDSSDYRVGDTRVIANPHGYGNENPNFDPSLVVEVGS
jgi:Icc-related predicted phosphoesterase